MSKESTIQVGVMEKNPYYKEASGTQESKTAFSRDTSNERFAKLMIVQAKKSAR